MEFEAIGSLPFDKCVERLLAEDGKIWRVVNWGTTKRTQIVFHEKSIVKATFSVREATTSSHYCFLPFLSANYN